MFPTDNRFCVLTRVNAEHLQRSEDSPAAGLTFQSRRQAHIFVVCCCLPQASQPLASGESVSLGTTDACATVSGDPNSPGLCSKPERWDTPNTAVIQTYNSSAALIF